jgi:hypothetical protein
VDAMRLFTKIPFPEPRKVVHLTPRFEWSVALPFTPWYCYTWFKISILQNWLIKYN